MKITPIASSSRGNAVLVDDGQTMLLLDAGIPYKELSRSVHISAIDGVLITHEHMDHCRAVPELLRRGCTIYASNGTMDYMKMPAGTIATYRSVRHGKAFTIGSFRVMPFSVRHDAAEPLGFVFQSESTDKKGIYVVDSGIIEWYFEGVTHWLIEANHYEAGLANADLDERIKQRIERNHMSFEKVKTFLNTSDLSKTEEIHLLHLSNGNSNEARFVSDIQKMTGVPVYVHGE